MRTRNCFAFGLLPVVLAAVAFSPAEPDVHESPRIGHPGSAEAQMVDDRDAQTCRFAIRAKNNLNLNIWIDLHDSTVLQQKGPAIFRKDVKLEIQNHRLTNGQSMDRRYTAAGRCDTRRSWIFWVRIDRPSGIKNHKMVMRQTEGSGDRTVNLGNSSTWGL